MGSHLESNVQERVAIVASARHLELLGHEASLRIFQSKHRVAERSSVGSIKLDRA